MEPKITNEIVEDCLDCSYKAFLKIAGAKGRKTEYELLFMELSHEYRRKALDSLVGRYNTAQILPDLHEAYLSEDKSDKLIFDVAVEDRPILASPRCRAISFSVRHLRSPPASGAISPRRHHPQATEVDSGHSKRDRQ